MFFASSFYSQGVGGSQDLCLRLSSTLTLFTCRHFKLGFGFLLLFYSPVQEEKGFQEESRFETELAAQDPIRCSSLVFFGGGGGLQRSEGSTQGCGAIKKGGLEGEE